MSFFDFHVHSFASIDSNMLPRKILRVAQKKGLKGIAITDHNTIRGGVDVKAKNVCKDFAVIIGSEIRTEICEIIGLFLNREIHATDPLNVIDEIKDQGGIAVLPHPFRSLLIPRLKQQKGISEEVLKSIQVIEINARTRKKDNQKAQYVASKLGKPMVAGSDAHFLGEIGRIKTVVPSYTNEEELKKNILIGRTRVEIEQNIFIKTIPFQLLSALYGRVRGAS